MCHKKILSFLILLLVFNLCCVAQNKQAITWLSFEQAQAKQKIDPKPILVDIYTDWCGWCKKMDKDTYGNPDIINYIEKNFYPVKFNAEHRGSIEYDNKIYINEQKAGSKSTHQLANMLLNNKMGYPATVFITEDSNFIPISGYMSPMDFEPLLVFLSEKIYISCEFELFKENFDNTFNPKNDSEKGLDVNWLAFDDALAKQKESPKKMFLYIHSELNYSAKVMLASCLRNPVIAEFLNTNYYPVKLDFDTRDTIRLGGDIFVNPKNMLGYPNQFVIALLSPDIRFPAISFFNEEFQMLFTLRGFFSPSTLERYLNFFFEEKYKDSSIDFKQYYENFDSKIDAK